MRKSKVSPRETPICPQRRNFLKSGIGLFGLSLLSGLSSRFSLAAAADKKDLPLVAETEPLAKSLNYKHDASAVPAKLRTKKFGVEGKDQTCKSCVYFTAKSANADEELGKCNLIVGKYVKNTGWCSSWMKKAGK